MVEFDKNMVTITLKEILMITPRVEQIDDKTTAMIGNWATGNGQKSHLQAAISFLRRSSTFIEDKQTKGIIDDVMSIKGNAVAQCLKKKRKLRIESVFALWTMFTLVTIVQKKVNKPMKDKENRNNYVNTIYKKSDNKSKIKVMGSKARIIELSSDKAQIVNTLWDNFWLYSESLLDCFISSNGHLKYLMNNLESLFRSLYQESNLTESRLELSIEWYASDYGRKSQQSSPHDFFDGIQCHIEFDKTHSLGKRSLFDIDYFWGIINSMVYPKIDISVAKSSLETVNQKLDDLKEFFNVSFDKQSEVDTDLVGIAQESTIKLDEIIDELKQLKEIK